MAELIADWWSWLAPATLQATALLVAAWVVDRAAHRRAWPQLVTTLWLVALARLMLPPTLVSPLSVTTALGAPTLAAASATTSDTSYAWLAAVWVSGAVTCLAARWRRRRLLARRLVELDANASASWRAALRTAASSLRLARTPRLGTFEELNTFAVSGLWQPMLLVPRAALERAPTRHDRHALLHELAHIRRRDLWLDEVCELVRAVFWFHPLVWIAVARIRALSEVACDASVARALGREAHAYRDTLVLAARDAMNFDHAGIARALVARPSLLFVRLEHLEQPSNTPIARVRLASAALASAMFACVLPMAPASAVMRANAQRVVDAQQRGERQSCFTFHAAAMVLAADATESSAPRQH